MPAQNTNALNLVEAYSQLEPEHLIICTFTLGLGYIEQKLLNEFKEKYNTKILIVSSTTGVSQSFDDLYALRGVGTNYILAKVEDTPFAFHPKIFLAIDKQKGPVLFVSGCNFTYPGMCHNLDAVDMIELSHADKGTIKNLQSFLQGLTELVIANEQKKIIAEILRMLPDGQNDRGTSTFIHNTHEAILPQMLSYIDEDIEEVKIISPYYDARMYALSEITKLRGQPKCSILCNNNDPHVNLANLPIDVSVFKTENDAESRFLHAKVYLFRTRTKTYSAVGSANCTTPGLLNSPGAEGNWETMIVREISSEAAESFYQSFSPVEVFSNEFWKYTAPPKNDSDTSHISFEAISHPGWLELKFNSNIKFEEISGQLTTKLVNGESETTHFNNIERNAQASYSIPITTNQPSMGDRPYLVELNLFAPTIARGATWVIQKHVLMRSRSTQQLLGKIDELQRDSENGWEQFESIMAFISGNLGFVTARQRKASQKKSKSATPSDVVFTIEGVKELDEEVPVDAHGNMPINDLVNFGKRIEDLFENGFLKIEGEDDESEEEANTQPAEKKGRKKGRNKDPKHRVQSPPPPDFQLPDLRMIYQTEFIEKYNNQINELSDNKAEDQFSGILSSVVFCFKLARFIHIELSHKYPELNRDPLQCFSAIAPLVNALPGWTQSVIKLHNLSQETCKEIFEDTGLLQEFVLFICETWAEDCKSSK